MPGGNTLTMFPGIYINLNLGTEKGEGGSHGSVVNHRFIVNNVRQRNAEWKAGSAGASGSCGRNGTAPLFPRLTWRRENFGKSELIGGRVGRGSDREPYPPNERLLSAILKETNTRLDRKGQWI